MKILSIKINYKVVPWARKVCTSELETGGDGSFTSWKCLMPGQGIPVRAPRNAMSFLTAGLCDTDQLNCTKVQ